MERQKKDRERERKTLSEREIVRERLRDEGKTEIYIISMLVSPSAPAPFDSLAGARWR